MFVFKREAYMITITGASGQTGSKIANILLDRGEEVRVISCSIKYEVTHEIGEKIGEPELPYVQQPDEDALRGLKEMGLSENLAESFVELAHALNEGRVTVTQGNPDVPTSPTKFDEVFYPMYENA